jgi:RNA polymerase sigma-70 factor, ECF subfamily
MLSRTVGRILRVGLINYNAFDIYEGIIIGSMTERSSAQFGQLNDGKSPEELGRLLVNQLRRASGSDREAFASLQHELRRIARSKMHRERPDHTLQPTALINEAFLKVFTGLLPMDFWADSATALKLIAHAMEQILNDHADAYRAQKRGGPERKRVPIDQQQAREFLDSDSFVQIDSALLIRPEQSETIVGVREALRILRRNSPRQASVIQLQFYGGLTQEEVAASLGVSLETVKLDTRKAKAFLKVHLEHQKC